MIPPLLREELEQDPFMKKCCLTGRTDGKIDFHHAMCWQGKNINEKFAILPVHNDIHQYHQGITKEVKEKLNWVMVNRMSEYELNYYSKAVNYNQVKLELNKKYDNTNRRTNKHTTLL